MQYSNLVSNAEAVSATEVIPGRKNEMKENLAGGMSFKIDDFTALRRWLLTGSFSNFFYESASKNTNENLDILISCIRKDPNEVAKEIVYASQNGTMASQHTCILALVHLSNGDIKAKQNFRNIFNKIIRTASHLYEFVSYAKQIRGMGKTIHKAVHNWIYSKDVSALEYQFLKYQQREGFSNRDVLRLFKPKPRNKDEDSLFAWVAQKDKPLTSKLEKIKIYEDLKEGKLSEKEIILAISKHGLTHEMMPANIKRTTRIWAALFYKMPITATIRNLATLTRNEVFENIENMNILEDKLSKESLIKSYISPLEIASALKIYSSGGRIGKSGNNLYVPKGRILDILEQAVQNSFEAAKPTNLSYFHALDISSSMRWSNLPGLWLTPAEVETIIALTTVKSEKNYYVGGFSDSFVPIPEFTKTSNINSLMKNMNKYGFGGTNAASAYKHAIKNNIHTDVFVFWTDSENWVGGQPSLLLKEYRKKINPKAKAIYITLTPYSSKVSLVDSEDPLSYDIAGFSTQTPKIISMIAEGII